MRTKGKISIAMSIALVLIIALSTVCYATPSKYGTIQVDNHLYYGTGEGIAETEIGTNPNPIAGVSYDQSTNTLTLNNYNGSNILLYRLGNDFKIKLIGTNKINNNWLGLSYPMAGEGIEGDIDTDYSTNVIFEGTGSLEINGCMYLDNMTVNGATVKVSSNMNETVGLENLKFIKGKFEITTTSTDSESHALYCNGAIDYADGTTYDNSNPKHITLEKVIEDINITDDVSGAKLSTTTENVSKDAQLKVNDVPTESLPNTLEDKTENYKGYDISLELDEQKIQPNGKVTVSLPIPSNMDKEKLTLYRIDGENLVEYSVKVEKLDNKDYATFETDNFSIYALAEKKVESEDITNDTDVTDNTDTTTNETENDKTLEKDDTPKTGNLSYAIATLVIIIAGVAIIALKKNKKQ